jgi:23S rRNA-/tRNA-specific pseudouridylate synthase
MAHRLDKDTSGVIVMCLNKKALGHVGQEFEQRRAKKSYVARVWGDMAEEAGLVDLPLATDWENKPRQRVDFDHGRQSRTEWHVEAREPGITRVRLHPLTGRTHQLRVHMLALGHPILGDQFYSTGSGARCGGPAATPRRGTRLQPPAGRLGRLSRAAPVLSPTGRHEMVTPEPDFGPQRTKPTR